jgi:hypothetical protein
MPGRDDRAPTPASVLMPLVLRPTGLTVLLTQRTAHLTDHAGQISFPAAAPKTMTRRHRHRAARIGRGNRPGAPPRRRAGHAAALSDRHRLLRHAGGGLLQPPFEVAADPGEVAAIFEVPLAFLMDGANHQRLSVDLPGGRRSFYAMPYEGYYIWGATAGMLRNLFHFLRA